MKRLLLALALCCSAFCSWSCTSAIVSGKLTANGRPLLWKNRDTGELNNRVKFIPAKEGKYAYVGLFDARDLRDTAVWIGYNEHGFAIMNTASYNLNSDDITDMDKEGNVMRIALECCKTVDDFENLLKTLPKPLGVEANFGAIDANGNGAYFETGNYKYVKYDLKDEPSGILTRTNYSYSGRPNEGYGFIREKNEQTILRPHILGHDITPAVFTEEVARTFYHSLIGENYTNGSQQWVVDLDFIPRHSSAATTVIEGVIPGEDASLTTMWIALGYPPCADVFQVWCEENGVPVVLQGTGENNHSPQCNLVLKRKNEVFPLTAGNGKEYLDITKLYNEEKTGFCQVLIPQNMETYKKGYEEIDKRRKALKANNKKKNNKK